MRFGRTAIKVAEAQARIAPFIHPGDTEQIALADSSGRYLAEDVTATHDVPHFRRSGMDGFAIRAADTRGATRERPVLLEVIETVPCGDVPTTEVATGQATRIMTGAAVPEGADAVVMFEMTDAVEREGKVYTAVKKEIAPGDNVTATGQEVQKGTMLLEKGRRINAGEAALLATFGYDTLSVYRQPTVAIFATGSELLPVGEAIRPGKIRNSNSYMLANQVENAGGIPYVQQILPDVVDEAEEAIFNALQTADMVITTGGVSVGDYDILVDILAKWDGDVLFNKLMMRPGSPTTVGRWRDTFLFALSGNPGACFVGFELFVRPVIAGMLGRRERELQPFTAILGADFPKPGAFPRYVRGKMSSEDGQVVVRPNGVDKSSITVSIVDADCLIVIPPGGQGVRAGERVTALKLNVAD